MGEGHCFSIQIDQIIQYILLENRQKRSAEPFSTDIRFRFRILTEDYETTKFQVLKEKSVHEVQVKENYQQSCHQKVSDTVLGDYEKLKVSVIAVIQLISL